MSDDRSSNPGLHPDEEALIRSFFARDYRQQFLGRLTVAGARSQMRDKLNHFRGIDPRYAHRIPPRDQTVERIHELLREKGAPTTCHVVGPSELDGCDTGLKDALQTVVPYSQGALISCIRGRLGYFQGEEPSERYILERRAYN